MKKLHFDYCMEIRYTKPVTRCFYTIKCIPQDTRRQKILQFQIEMFPESKPEWSFDAHHNRYIYGCNQEPHDYFKYRISGEAETGCAEYEEDVTPVQEMLYRHSHGLTVAGPKLKAFYEEILLSCPDFSNSSPLVKAKILSDQLFEHFHYVKGSTTVATGAEEAFVIGQGVCQDYAHILVSLLIMAGCSARYVNGFLLGEGESHAWVEVADQGRWIGIDPTNHKLVDTDYIRIGVGRDATECQLNRGIMHGGGKQEQEISASVTEITAGQQLMKKGALL